MRSPENCLPFAKCAGWLAARKIDIGVEFPFKTFKELFGEILNGALFTKGRAAGPPPPSFSRSLSLSRNFCERFLRRERGSFLLQ